MHQQISNFWVFIGLLAVIIFVGAITAKDRQQIPTRYQIPRPKERKPAMPVKTVQTAIENTPVAADTLADDYILNHVIGHSENQDECHKFIRTSAKYKAKLITYQIKDKTAIHLYEFTDHSLLEIEEEIGSRQFRLKGKL